MHKKLIRRIAAAAASIALAAGIVALAPSSASADEQSAYSYSTDSSFDFGGYAPTSFQTFVNGI